MNPQPSMTKVRIEFDDAGPDAHGRRRYRLFWWSTAQQRDRAQWFYSTQWSEHQEMARRGSSNDDINA